jgi:hypothetical protein
LKFEKPNPESKYFRSFTPCYMEETIQDKNKFSKERERICKEAQRAKVIVIQVPPKDDT